MKKVLSFCVAVVVSLMAVAQDHLAFLRGTYPKLTELYQSELQKYSAHYVFAIDVSGTMNQYAGMVIPALKPFISALPDGDMVSVIPFGTEAKSLVGFSGKITPSVRQTILGNMDALYVNSNFDQAFKAHTDMHRAMNGVSAVINRNPDYKVNVVIVLTDFRNDMPAVGERKLTGDELDDIAKNYKAALYGTYNRSVALELPVNRSAPGYCLDQLKDKVFPKSGDEALEVVPLTNSSESINQWFDQLKREIMIIKLKAVIDAENKVSKVTLKTDIDIDGNIFASVDWEPGKLYQTLKMDSSFLANGGNFRIVADSSIFCKVRDSHVEQELGQIKHKQWGFHHLTDTVQLGLSLPTDYDDELTKLGVSKPLAGSSVPVERLVFTFFLPLWLTATLLALLIIYVMMVFNAIKRNASAKFKGKVTVTSPEGEMLVPNKRIPECDAFSVGKGGATVRVDDAEWRIEVRKVCPSPLLVFSKPYFRWAKQGGGYVGVPRSYAQSGRLDSKQTMVMLECGKGRKDISHKVKIILM